MIWAKGMSVPWLMRASLLSMARMRGLEMMRSMPDDSAAERRTPRFTALLIEPKVRPIAPPLPVPTAAGRVTAKFGVATGRSKGERPAGGGCGTGAPPATGPAAGGTTPGRPFLAADADAAPRPLAP